MSAESAFLVLNSLALFCWILLIGFYHSLLYKSVISSGLVFVLFGVIYLFLLLTNLPTDLQAFTSLSNMKSLYSNPWAILLGWVHYLSFDLLAGIWIKKDSEKQEIGTAWVIPSLVLTFMLGPFGLLSYLIIKLLRKGNARVE